MEVAFFEFILLAEGMSRRWPVLYLAIALAVLAKGPVGLVLPAGAAVIWVALERRWNLLRALHLWWGALLILVIDGGWYLAASWSAGTAFIQKQILAENLFRFFPSAAFHEGHIHSFLYVEGALIAGFMPWSLILPGAAFRFFKSRDRSRSPRLSYLAVWFLTVLVFYNLARSKRGVYLLALYPALATMAGTWFCDVQSLRGHINRWVRASSLTVGIFFVAAGLSALLALWALFYSPETFHGGLQTLGIKASGFVPALQYSVERYPSIAAVVSLAAVAIGIFLSASRETIQSIFAGVGAGVSIIALGANLVVIPAIADTLSLKPFSAAIGHAVGEESVEFLGGIIYEVAFYSGVPIQVIKPGDRSVATFFVCWKPVYLAMAPEMRRHFVPVVESGPTALDGSGGVLLLKSLLAEAS
jgi:4-amino-4-deoxy-L-arabinose transferase-like glycosyltransferase